MSTNFFTQIAQMNIEGNLQINIQPNETEYIVSVLLQNDHCGDNAKNLIPPLVLKGTAEALDIGFLEKIIQPLEQSSDLMVNMESYLKAQEEARKQSAMEKEKAEKERKAKEERTKKFQKAMEKAEKLEQEKHGRLFLMLKTFRSLQTRLENAKKNCLTNLNPTFLIISKIKHHVSSTTIRTHFYLTR